MRHPNGYGTVYKMHGTRRRPYIASLSVPGPDNKTIRKALGYYATKREALAALAAYHNNPYDVSERDVSVHEFYVKWLQWRQERGKGLESLRLIDSAYRTHIDSAIGDMRLIDIEALHIQRLIDAAKTPAIAQRIRLFFSSLYKYAALCGLMDKNVLRLVDMPPVKKSTMHKPFTSDEIAHLWSVKNRLVVQIALVLIYTGLRPGELIQMKPENVHIDDRYMIGGLKTDAGRDRVIPIARKILPIIASWHSPDQFCPIPNYYRLRYIWSISHDSVILNHKPHDGRHTCETLLDDARISKRVIQLIIGHAGRDVDEKVYTHKTIGQLIEAIDQI